MFIFDEGSYIFSLQIALFPKRNIVFVNVTTTEIMMLNPQSEQLHIFAIPFMFDIVSVVYSSFYPFYTVQVTCRYRMVITLVIAIYRV